MDSQRRKVNAAWLSVISNSSLIVIKIAVGILIGSVAIISEAVHSGVDLVAALIALFSIKKSSIPADKKHPFGHGKIENISGTIEAVLIFLAAGWIIYEAFRKLGNPEPLASVSWGVAVMLVSAVTNTIVSARLFRVGRETDSIALQADAWHLRTDVYTSAGVMVGLALIWLGRHLWPGMNLDWIDPVSAIAVALLIMWAAYNLTRQSAGGLLDVQLPLEEEAWIRDLIIKQQPTVHGFHHLRTRKAGHYRFVESHIKVDPRMTVEDSHRITEEISRAIEKQFPKTSVLIHVEPCDGYCADTCLEGCLLTDKGRQAVQKKPIP